MQKELEEFKAELGRFLENKRLYPAIHGQQVGQETWQIRFSGIQEGELLDKLFSLEKAIQEASLAQW